MLLLCGLSERELEEICSLPQVAPEEIFGEVEVWLEQNKEVLQAKHPNKHVHIDARTLVFTIGDTHDDAANQHYGPVGRDGRNFVCQWLRPRA